MRFFCKLYFCIGLPFYKTSGINHSQEKMLIFQKQIKKIKLNTSEMFSTV